MNRLNSTTAHKNQKEYFEYVGRITVAYTVTEIMGLELLAYLINRKNNDIGYFIANEYHERTYKKFELIRNLIKNEPYNTVLSNNLKNFITKTLDEFEEARQKRNKIIHGIMVFDRNVDYADIIGYDKKINKLKVVKKININELVNLFMELNSIQINIEKILKKIKEIMIKIE